MPAQHNPTIELLTLAMPMIGMTVSRMLIGIIDAYMVSHLGTAAQAAITPSTLLLFAISCVGMGMAQGVQTFVSQADGRGEPEKAGAYVWQALYISAVSGVLTIPVAFFTPVWFDWFAQRANHPQDVRNLEVQFLSISLWSVGPATACAALDSFYNGIRRPRIGLYALLASLVTIVVGNYVMIFGHFGCPPLGIAGSAIATVLSWLVRMAVLMAALWLPEIDSRFHTRRSAAPQTARIREIVRLGWPISLQWLVDIGAWVVFQQWMMPAYGTIAMAAASIAVQYMHLSFMPALGVGMALTTQVGNAIGAGRLDEVWERVRVARRVIVGYMGLMGLLFVVAGRLFGGWFCFETDPTLRDQVIETTAHLLIWCALFQLSDALCIVYSFASRGAGDTRVPALLFFVCCWGIFVAGGLAATKWLPQFGVNGPWMMCTIYIVILGVLLWMRFTSGRWRSIRIFDKEPRGFPLAPPADNEKATGSPVAAVHE